MWFKDIVMVWFKDIFMVWFKDIVMVWFKDAFMMQFKVMFMMCFHVLRTESYDLKTVIMWFEGTIMVWFKTYSCHDLKTQDLKDWTHSRWSCGEMQKKRKDWRCDKNTKSGQWGWMNWSINLQSDLMWSDLVLMWIVLVLMWIDFVLMWIDLVLMWIDLVLSELMRDMCLFIFLLQIVKDFCLA
jgi:hypothetical protein